MGLNIRYPEVNELDCYLEKENLVHMFRLKLPPLPLMIINASDNLF